MIQIESKKEERLIQNKPNAHVSEMLITFFSYLYCAKRILLIFWRDPPSVSLFTHGFRTWHRTGSSQKRHSVLTTNVSLSHTSLVGIVLKKRNNFKDQFYIIIFGSTEMNYSDFIFFLQSKHMVFKPYKRIICSGLIKWCSFIRLFNY